LVAGHVHDPDPCPVRQVEVGEPQVDGDAAPLLLLEAVGLDAGEGADEGGLAVVDVPGRPDDDPAFRVVHHGWSTSARNGRERIVAPSATGCAMKRSRRIQYPLVRSSATATPATSRLRLARAAAGTVRPVTPPAHSRQRTPPAG